MYFTEFQCLDLRCGDQGSHTQDDSMIHPTGLLVSPTEKAGETGVADGC